MWRKTHARVMSTKISYCTIIIIIVIREKKRKDMKQTSFLVNDWYSVSHCVSLILDSRYTWHEGGVHIQYSSWKLCRFIYFFCSVYICFLSVIYHFDLPFSLDHFSYRNCNQIEVTVSVIYVCAMSEDEGDRFLPSLRSLSSFSLSLRLSLDLCLSHSLSVPSSLCGKSQGLSWSASWFSKRTETKLLRVVCLSPCVSPSPSILVTKDRDRQGIKEHLRQWRTGH